MIHPRPWAPALVSGLWLVGLSLVGVAASKPPAPPPGTPLDASLWKGMEWRNIGPYRGGRVTTVVGHPREPRTFYMGATGGGVWRTTDGGVSWQPLSDGYFGTGSVGALGISDSDPNVIYAGMGEAPIRGNVSHGDGVYKSTDGGRSWRPVGLRDTRHVARVRVHPTNPDLVYVAAQGHAFGPNAERGIFRSKDGGATWQKILYVDDKTGASELAVDPSNPRVMFAGFWQARRSPWGFESGGPGSSSVGVGGIAGNLCPRTSHVDLDDHVDEPPPGAHPIGNAS